MDAQYPIIALDFNNIDDVRTFLSAFGDTQLNLKIGMELFYSIGRPLVDELVNAGHAIFLDLKLHDIPNTVERTMFSLAKLGVAMVNVHASGGIHMMKAAKYGLESGAQHNTSPLLIAVTQLTSLSEKEYHDEQRGRYSLNDSILHYAKLTQEAGLDGVVCSPHEANAIQTLLGKQFMTVTPGIRLNPQQKTDDQTRIATPQSARSNGSTFIVVGRPITRASDPVTAYQLITREWQLGQQEGESR